MSETIAFGAPKIPAPDADTVVTTRQARTVAEPGVAGPTLVDAERTIDTSLPVRPTATSRTSLGVDATLVAEDARFSMAPRVEGPRTTVLPRMEGTEVVHASGRARYERLQSLGEGGMGEVALAQDNDIDRRVAIKRLRAEHRGSTALLRFAQEVRTIGRLEHPNIVPVHDVGVDEDGQHYFVMKYVEGETLESVIAKLQARDPAYERRFPYEVRAQVFLGILRAVQYAHARGIMHRDLKPANVMVGPYGEVMVMDWGIARPVRGPEIAPMEGAAPADGAASSLETQHGTIMGTPHYMSPEQARGETDKINERSDVYALSVIFHELMSLRHYLDGKTSVHEVLAAVASVGEHERNIIDWVADAAATGAPMEFLHYIRKGVSPTAADRYANAGEMADGLEDILAGRMKVQCHISLTKRVAHSAMHAIDRHPIAATVVLLGGVGSALAGVVSLAQGLLRLAHVG